MQVGSRMKKLIKNNNKLKKYEFPKYIIFIKLLLLMIVRINSPIKKETEYINCKKFKRRRNESKV